MYDDGILLEKLQITQISQHTQQWNCQVCDVKIAKALLYYTNFPACFSIAFYIFLLYDIVVINFTADFS